MWHPPLKCCWGKRQMQSPNENKWRDANQSIVSTLNRVTWLSRGTHKPWDEKMWIDDEHEYCGKIKLNLLFFWLDINNFRLVFFLFFFFVCLFVFRHFEFKGVFFFFFFFLYCVVLPNSKPEIPLFQPVITRQLSRSLWGLLTPTFIIVTSEQWSHDSHSISRTLLGLGFGPINAGDHGQEQVWSFNS